MEEVVLIALRVVVHHQSHPHSWHPEHWLHMSSWHLLKVGAGATHLVEHMMP